MNKETHKKDILCMVVLATIGFGSMLALFVTSLMVYLG